MTKNEAETLQKELHTKFGVVSSLHQSFCNENEYEIRCLLPINCSEESFYAITKGHTWRWDNDLLVIFN